MVYCKLVAPTDFVVVVVQPLPENEVAASKEPEPQYNAWGKPTTKKSMLEAIHLRA